MPLQSNWRWCAKCQGLAYAGYSAPGACPGGDGHNPNHAHGGSWDYTLKYNEAPIPEKEQDNWRWCRKCHGLAFAGHGDKPCPAGGIHEHTGSGNYVLTRDRASGPDQQGYWRWCSKCCGLAFVGGGWGPCPAGGAHDHTISVDYFLPFVPSPYLTTAEFPIRASKGAKVGDGWRIETQVTVSNTGRVDGETVLINSNNVLGFKGGAVVMLTDEAGNVLWRSPAHHTGVDATFFSATKKERIDFHYDFPPELIPTVRGVAIVQRHTPDANWWVEQCDKVIKIGKGIAEVYAALQG